MTTEIDERRSSTIGGPGSIQPARPTPLRRAGNLFLAFLNPLSDVMVIYRTGIKPLGEKLRILREQLNHRSTPKETLSWAEAIHRSQRSAEQLSVSFRRIRAVWWLVMTVTGAFAIMLCLMLILANINLPIGTFIRAVVTDLVLSAVGLFALAKVLSTNFRIWQLSNKRVSVEECGTFQNYRAENSMWLQVVSPKSPFWSN